LLSAGSLAKETGFAKPSPGGDSRQLPSPPFFRRLCLCVHFGLQQAPCNIRQEHSWRLSLSVESPDT
jgi:hypothetical protein